jgi:HSP20 family molecular chaperone IbpA
MLSTIQEFKDTQNQLLSFSNSENNLFDVKDFKIVETDTDFKYENILNNVERDEIDVRLFKNHINVDINKTLLINDEINNSYSKTTQKFSHRLNIPKNVDKSTFKVFMKDKKLTLKFNKI